MDHHSTASEMGMMGALRTGNMVVDMMIAMMVPYIFKLLMDLANGHGIENLRAVIFFWSPYHTRDIEHKILQTSWGGTVNQDRDLRNNVLIKAVQLYLDAHKIAYRNANLQLMSTKQESSSIWADSDDEGENTPAGKLKRFKVARKPPKHRWSRISAEGQPLVELMVTEHENDKGEKAEKTVVTHLYKFRSTTAGAIDAFVDKTYEWYIEELVRVQVRVRVRVRPNPNPNPNQVHRGAQEAGGQLALPV